MEWKERERERERERYVSDNDKDAGSRTKNDMHEEGCNGIQKMSWLLAIIAIAVGPTIASTQILLLQDPEIILHINMFTHISSRHSHVTYVGGKTSGVHHGDGCCASAILALLVGGGLPQNEHHRKGSLPAAVHDPENLSRDEQRPDECWKLRISTKFVRFRRLRQRISLMRA